MLDSYEHRKGISLSFGLVASLCLNVLLSNYERLYGVDLSIAISEWPAFTQSKSLFSTRCAGKAELLFCYPFM